MNWPVEYQAKDGRPISVRHVAYGDAPTLHSGMLEVAQEGIYIGTEPEGVRDLPSMIERVRISLITPRMAQLVGELDQQVVGTISIQPGRFGNKGRHWCQLAMWVVPAGRNVGVGKDYTLFALRDGTVGYGRSRGRVVAFVE